jgi:hypothetical protein
MSQFSPDGSWWWNGSDWIPARSPDGRQAVWTGSRWVRSGSTGAVLAIAASLWVVEIGLFVVAIIVLIFVANEEYVARGQTGYEDIAATSISIEVLIGLLILPLVITAVVSARSRRWWAGPLAGGALPTAVAVLGQHWAAAPVTSAAVSILVPAAFIATGLIANRLLFVPWTLSADGRWWRRGATTYSTMSTDGRWRWDGLEWQRALPGGQ